MIKFIIFLFIFYFGFKFLKRWLVKRVLDVRTGRRNSSLDVNDVMVQDPHCGMYFPRKSGVHLVQGGKNLFFCSPKCRDEFLSKD